MTIILKQLKRWLIKYIGLNEACLLPDKEFHERIAQHLLVTAKVWGSKDRIKLGRGVVLNDVLINTSSGDVTVKDFVFFGHSVCLITGHHEYTKTNIQRQVSVPLAGRDIVIEEGVWIGSNVTVLGPCIVGKNAVVAAGSVVKDHVAPNCIYAGVPARKIRSIECDD